MKEFTQAFAFFQLDRETPINKISITKSDNNILVNIYAKNISGVRQTNIRFAKIHGVNVLSSIPKAVLGGQGFDIELEISRSNEFKGTLDLFSDPEQVVFE